MEVRLSLKFLILLSLLATAYSQWKKCSMTFCGRIRNIPENYPHYTLDMTTAKITDGIFQADLVAGLLAPTLKLSLEALNHFTSYKVFISEKQPAKPRFRAEMGLDPENPAKVEKLVEINKTPENITLGDKQKFSETISAVIIHANHFKIEVYKETQLISIINAEDRLVFETDTDNTAIALDISFPGVYRAYGLPERAEHLALRSTILNGQDPYRHFNVDYGYYLLWSTEALYGTIPVLYAHAPSHTSGVFWLNAAQTWVDTKIVTNQVDAFFMSESGVMELYILTGSTLPETVKQYAKLTGTAPLPQYFTLGYHQSRYSYMSQDEVLSVVDNYDDNNLPVDVLWLDIDYTEGKKYFTWDPNTFSDPAGLQTNLNATNRKLVAIIDPHIKTEKGYFLHDEATKKGYYLKYPNGSDYVGECWPGDSSYLDFLNPDALDYYASLYNDNHFEGKNIHVWNDMNEPAVFNTVEKTVPHDAVHYSNWKHLDVHNMYGFYQTIGTQEGLLRRNIKVRPFILTRSHFAGIQRYAAIWTGDNAATWEYLQVSLPMCLTEALAGVSFCGADVGGFFGIPDEELIQRWYQAGAWLPFYRGHSTIDVPRREIYLYPGDVQSRIRTAIEQRYAHLPTWYTLFREHELTGEPVIRPMTYHYASEADVLSMEDQFLVGADILVAPVLNAKQFIRPVYLPGGKPQIWYNINNNYEILRGTGQHNLDVDINSIPVFYRGGSIIFRKDIPRKATVDTYKDPYTIYVCLNDENEAHGSLYVDDYESFDYKNNKYLHIGLTFTDNILSSSKLNENANYDNAAPITGAIILKPPQDIVNARFTDEDNEEGYEIQVEYSEDHGSLHIRGFSANIQKPFKIELA